MRWTRSGLAGSKGFCRRSNRHTASRDGCARDLGPDAVLLVNLSGRRVGPATVERRQVRSKDDRRGTHLDYVRALKAEGRTGLVTYITAGDPSLERTRDALLALARSGADVIEVGVPFSDPLADGPVIQRATERALAAGATLDKVLTLVADVRPQLEVPLVLFTYANPVARMGFEAFARRAAGSGVDGVLTLDLPVEEAGEFRELLRNQGLDTIFLLSPTTTDERIRRAGKLGSGFLYGISRLGVTGARAQVATGAVDLAARIRRETTLPLALGFGISRPEHVQEIGRVADAAVVGSGLVQVIAEAGDSPSLVPAVEQYVQWLTARGAAGGRRRDGEPGRMSIDDPGRRIDALDERIVELLNERASCALRIGEIKQQLGLEIYQPERESQVLSHVREHGVATGGPLGGEALTRLFERIIDEARRLERESATAHGGASGDGRGGEES
jgi:tryptophan synthase alpha chain